METTWQRVFGRELHKLLQVQQMYCVRDRKIYKMLEGKNPSFQFCWTWLQVWTLWSYSLLFCFLLCSRATDRCACIPCRSPVFVTQITSEPNSVLLQGVEITGSAGKAALARWCRVRHPLITSCMLNQLICAGKRKKIVLWVPKKLGVIFPGSWVVLLGSVSVARWIPALIAAAD